MRVEGRDLVDLGLRHLHLVGERGEMRRREVAVVILDEVEMLDQQVAAARPVGEQGLDLGQRVRVDLAALRGPARPVAALPALVPGFRLTLGNCLGI